MPTAKDSKTSQPGVPSDLTARLEGLLMSQQGQDAEFEEAEASDTGAPEVDFEFRGAHYRVTVAHVPED